MFNKRFKNIVDAEEWLITVNIYKNHQKEMNVIKNNLINKYKFSNTLAEDSILYELSLLVYRENNPLKKKNIFLSFLSYYLIFFILILIIPILFLHNIFQKKHKYSVLFEEMWDERSLYSRFYKQVHKYFNNDISVALLLTAPFLKKITNINNIKDWKNYTIDTRNNNILYNLKIVLQVIKNDFFFGASMYKLSYNIDLLFLYLRLLRRILMSSSQVSNVSADIIVSAVDYYWNPIKYFYYKNNVKHVILIQHNHKDNYLFGRALMYCDYYFAHSDDAIRHMAINIEAKIKSVGSLQLVDFLNSKDDIFEYDILFINQTVNDNLKNCAPSLNQNLLIENHSILIDNFGKYLSKYKNINAIYMAKPTYIGIEPAKSVKNLFSNNKNIKFVEAYGQETFHIVNKAKIIINMYSSVGREAYGLDKKVLWINYDNCCDIFGLDVQNDDIHTLVADKTYNAFEEKINLILSDNKEVDEHYKKLKQKYMNIEENPAEIIAKKIEELLLEKK